MNNKLQDKFLFVVINCFPIKSFNKRIHLHHILAMFLKSSKMLSKESFSFAVYLNASGKSCYWIFSSNKKIYIFKKADGEDHHYPPPTVLVENCIFQYFVQIDNFIIEIQ